MSLMDMTRITMYTLYTYNLITKYLDQGDQETGGGAEGESVSTCADNRLCCCVVIVMRMMVRNILMIKLNTNLTFVR